MPTDSEIRRFAGAPWSSSGPHATRCTLPPRRLSELQLSAVQLRFAEVRDRLPVLRALADEQDIHEIRGLDEVAPLLFPRAVYQSYPASLLLEGRFDLLTTWLSRLTTVDLGGLDTDGCHSIDGWLELLDTRTELRLAHSSGASGSMAFVPHTHADFDRLHEIMRLEVFPGPGQREEGIDVVFRTCAPCAAASAATPPPSPSGSRARGPGARARPGLASADVMFLAGGCGRRRGAASATGAGTARAAGAERGVRRGAGGAAGGLGAYVERLADTLRGRRVVSLSGADVAHRMARTGLERGVEGLFAPDSLVGWGGAAGGGRCRRAGRRPRRGSRAWRGCTVCTR
ncbi:hypothetical protein NKH77_17760 [Streptomyces sp. M19]